MSVFNKYDWFKEDPADFIFKEKEIAGDLCVLINALPSITWTDSNKIYRSSIWRVSDGYPISLGFKKFTNFDEQPLFEPVSIEDLSGEISYIEKLDGSCLIVSKYNDKLIVRTRGSFNAFEQANGSELNELLESNKFIDLFKDVRSTNFSLLFEWVTPTNQIVINYSEPRLFLIGLVYHVDYSYGDQLVLDALADEYDCFRPKRFNLDNFGAYLNVLDYIKDWTYSEGVIMYFNSGQLLKKVKSDWYCRLHRLKSDLSSKSKVVKSLYASGLLNDLTSFNRVEIENTFFNLIKKDFDFEIATFIKPNLISILDKIENTLIKHYQIIVERLNELEDRNDPKLVLELFKKYPDLDQSLTWMLYRNKTLDERIILKYSI